MRSVTDQGCRERKRKLSNWDDSSLLQSGLFEAISKNASFLLKKYLQTERYLMVLINFLVSLFNVLAYAT